jgi:hypothetical protein
MKVAALANESACGRLPGIVNAQTTASGPRLRPGFNNPLAHWIEAGADLFLCPRATSPAA